MSPESALARAVFAHVVADLAIPERPPNRWIAGEARAWLFADDDPEVVTWREQLATLADINLEQLREAVDDAPWPTLRKVARLLDKGGRW